MSLPNNILKPLWLRIAIITGFALAAALSSPSDAWSGESPADLFGTMYWTHRDEGVYVAARDGSDVKLLVPGNFADGLAIDIPNGKLYWTISSGLNKIQKANLDGTDVEDV
ncbi:MAG TPA: hypothetical protein VFI31_23125, partial [Pirellulales bacterium]|nr:hypothetical protein [Pirellulales bacterium]